MAMRTHAVLIAIAIGALPPLAAAQSQPRPPRTFPQFVGVWTLDEAASTGRLNIVPRIPLTLTIETTPETITVTKRPRLQPADRASASPPPEVYRLDGTETPVRDARVGALLDVSYQFALVADMLALTKKEGRYGSANGFNLITDAYSVEGDVLTLHRQLVAVSPSRTIVTMAEPTNNFRHTFIYRRTP